ncbi:MAG TPA: subclass B3 metallo-beta-lactamase [Bryobacteraceae bacterium]|nr:subclass B3 metallo-beta-lactamase [Bryobacteraceae bacterium]
MRRLLLVFLLFFPLLAADNRSTWNKPHAAFKIYGNTYYVGTNGLGSVLITSPTGHILIDGALPESASPIVANIRSLGFRIEDVKLILNSHVHYDHAGGIAELQKLSGARVAASAWTADVMRKGAVPRDDPQYGIIVPIARIANVEIIHDGDVLTAGGLKITAHFTPGHTPGGTSWTWQSCENGRCLNLVYADSVMPVSADGFKFSHRKEFPHAEDFERSFAFLESTPCDILITPHPEASNLWDRLANHALVDPSACHSLALTLRERLKQRLASE